MRLLAKSVCSLGLAGLLALIDPAPSQAAPTKPFPQHVTYTAGTIKPSNHTQAELDQSVKQLYTSWKANFLRAGCGTGRYYVYMGPQPAISEGTPISVSEGQGYGMMIVALMAGYDPNAQTIFNGLYHFYRDHPTLHSPYLMAWRQLASCKSSSDANSATDGDVAIAHALLLAHRQWGSNGSVNYYAAAMNILKAIRKYEIQPSTNLPQMGDWVDPSYPSEYNAVRTSDITPHEFKQFYWASNDYGWWATVDRSYKLLNKLQATYAPVTALFPDFATNTNTTPQPAPTNFVGDYFAGHYYFNACRIPWHLATDYLLLGDPNAYKILTKMEDWVSGSTGNNIYALYAGYKLDGSPINYYNYVCFTGAFGTAAMINGKYQLLLNSIWNDLAQTTTVDTVSDSYGWTLHLIYMIVMSGNWWAP